MTPAAPTIGVLALQGDVREHLTALAALGARTRPVRRPDDLADLQGIVIPGGESTTICRLLDVFDLRDELVARLRGGMAAFGSCAGMITLAGRILDGRPDQRPLGVLDITVRRNAFGRQVDSFETDLVVAGFADAGLPAGPIHAVFIRAPWVEQAGPDVEVLATVTVQAAGLGGRDAPGPAGARPAPGPRPVAVRQGTVLATSFHPEITADDRIHRLFLAMARQG